MKCSLLLTFVVAASAVYDNDNAVCKQLLDDNSPSPEANDECVTKGTKQKCENCMEDKDCAETRFCCPYLKKCVYNKEACYYPIANCRPSCYNSNDPTLCTCSDTDFPNSWVSCTDDPTKFAYYGEVQNTDPVTYTRDEDSDGYLLNSDKMAQGALCNHNRLRSAAGLNSLEWSSCLAKFAKDYAEELKATDNCNMTHSNGSRRSNLCGFSYVGENLYWARNGEGIDQKAQRDAGWVSTQAWWDEIRDYVYPVKTDGTPDGFDECPRRKEREQTGHFTQVMWADSTHIGCDQALCSDSHVVVCVYGKGGNIRYTPAFSLPQRNTLNTSPEAAVFGGLPTCTDGGAPNDDGVNPDDYTTTAKPTTTTTTTTTTTEETTTRDIPAGGDGKCMGQWGNECKFPVDTPWGVQNDCSLFKRMGYSKNYCFLYSYGGYMYVDTCKGDDADCVF